MARSYSDFEKVISAQISYLNVDGMAGCSVQTIVDNIIQKFGDKAQLSSAEKTQLERAKWINENGQGVGLDNWTVKAVCNDNDKSGYYGVLIDTGDNSAIVANRGSEPQMDALMNDWVNNDFDFLDGDGMSSQEEMSKKFMEDIWYEYGQDYDGFTVTGHSLGGHLAMNQGITAPIGMQEKIVDVTSLDGPGFSDEYAEKYEKEINRIAPKMTHYRFSIVGSLLPTLPGVIPIYLSSEGGDSIKEIFDKHSLPNLRFDENGNAERLEDIKWYQMIGLLTEKLEKMTEWERIELLSRIINNVPLGAFVPVIKILLELLVIVVILKKSYVAVHDWAVGISKKIKATYNDIKYALFKPQVSGTYDMNISMINSIKSDLYSTLKEAKGYADDARITIRSMNCSWSSFGYLKSKIKANINSIENAIKKLEKMQKAMEYAADRYRNADQVVENLFSCSFTEAT